MAKKNKNQTPKRPASGPRQAQRKQNQLGDAKYHLQGWFPLVDRPEIKKDQTVQHLTVTINATKAPGLALYEQLYENVDIKGVSVRFKTAMVNHPGLHAITVVQPHSSATIPNPPKHLWARNRGSSVKRTTLNVSSPHVQVQGGYILSAAGQNYGKAVYIWEGPKTDRDEANIGELEVYIDAIYTERK